jgi:hypothetical protein
MKEKYPKVQAPQRLALDVAEGEEEADLRRRRLFNLAPRRDSNPDLLCLMLSSFFFRRRFPGPG